MFHIAPQHQSLFGTKATYNYFEIAGNGPVIEWAEMRNKWQTTLSIIIIIVTNESL